MESYANALSYAIPGFVILVLVEHIAGRIMGIEVNRSMDTISSLSSGITNALKSLTGLSVVILSYEWMVDHFALFDFKSRVWMYILAFIGLDFAGYWSHRFNHTINVFWNRHIIHHSSEEYNLSCALRQSISAIVGVYFFLYLPMAVVGVPAGVVGVVAPIHFFSQFWYHTRLIGKLGWLEQVIVTPSHHRVHHAINPEYLDKNFSEIFIVWDKLFGTFQEEIPEITPVYGVKRPVGTWNPIIINFMHLRLLIRDAWYTRRWYDKLRIWFMPTGWRPADVSKRFPIAEDADIYSRKKYDTVAGLGVHLWSWIQLIITLVIMYFMLIRIAHISFDQILLLAFFLLLSIYSYTTLMDRNGFAVGFELLKVSLGVYLYYYFSGSWLGATFGDVFLVVFPVYLFLSLALTLLFTVQNKWVGLMWGVKR